jgi:hypothetical protein
MNNEFWPGLLLAALVMWSLDIAERVAESRREP